MKLIPVLAVLVQRGQGEQPCAVLGSAPFVLVPTWQEIQHFAQAGVGVECS